MGGKDKMVAGRTRWWHGSKADQKVCLFHLTGHTNIQVPSNHTRESYLKTLRDNPVPISLTRSSTQASTSKAKGPFTEPSLESKDEEEGVPVVGYHRDSYPWVVVVMLSDVSQMRGGETAIREFEGFLPVQNGNLPDLILLRFPGRGDGTIVKAIGPNIGSAVVMQVSC